MREREKEKTFYQINFHIIYVAWERDREISLIPNRHTHFRLFYVSEAVNEQRKKIFFISCATTSVRLGRTVWIWWNITHIHIIHPYTNIRFFSQNCYALSADCREKNNENTDLRKRKSLFFCTRIYFLVVVVAAAVCWYNRKSKLRDLFECTISGTKKLDDDDDDGGGVAGGRESRRGKKASFN